MSDLRAFFRKNAVLRYGFALPTVILGSGSPERAAQVIAGIALVLPLGHLVAAALAPAFRKPHRPLILLVIGMALVSVVNAVASAFWNGWDARSTLALQLLVVDCAFVVAAYRTNRRMDARSTILEVIGSVVVPAGMIVGFTVVRDLIANTPGSVVATLPAGFLLAAAVSAAARLLDGEGSSV